MVTALTDAIGGSFLHLAESSQRRPSGIAGRGLFAVEPIQVGEIVAIKGGHIVGTELTTDYASMECPCGQATCRGTIPGEDGRRPDLQERFGGYFSTYLQHRIAAGLD
jgi:hypothetical protein